MTKKRLAFVALSVALSLPAFAQIKVGVITGATGPGASLGIPYKNTFSVLPKTLGGQPVEYIVMDDATDPTNAVKLARKLIVEQKVDLIIGSSSVPAATAITDVAAELKTPQLALSPVGGAASKNPTVAHRSYIWLNFLFPQFSPHICNDADARTLSAGSGAAEALEPNRRLQKEPSGSLTALLKPRHPAFTHSSDELLKYSSIPRLNLPLSMGLSLDGRS